MERGGLLKTKLYLPQSRGRMVERPRLTARLQEGLARKLTLISAPPGFGKSTVINAWRATPAGRSFPLAWLSLDEADNDPARFWFYVIAALGELQPGVGQEALALLQGARSAPITAMLQMLINDLIEFESDFALVLDDYHFIETAAIHEGVAFLLDRMGPQMHLVLTTRADPPLPLSRLRARDEVVEIRVKDLRFTAEESAQFLHEVQGLELNGADLEALTARTEGWVTGLQLAALSLKATEDRTSFMAAMTGNHRYIVDYLMEEVLQQQPEETQRFLLLTSVLPRLSGPLCDAVTGEVGSQALLERLEQSNLFTVALDSERRWFRYHQLLSTVMRGRLLQSEPEALAALCGRASAWFEAEGLLEDAIRMALEGRQFERAADLLAQLVDEFWRRGETETLRAFLKELPPAQLRGRADVALIRTRLALADGDFAIGAEAIGDAEALADVDSGELAAYRSVLARVQNDPSTAIEWAEKALARLPERPVSWGQVAATSLALAQAALGEIDAAKASLSNVERISQSMGDEYFTAVAIGIQAELIELQGQLRYAFDSYQRADRLGRSRTMQNAGMPRVGMGRVLLERYELTAAAALIDEGLRIGLTTSHIDTLFRGFIAQIQLRLLQGDLPGAEATVQQIDQVLPSAQMKQVELLLGAACVQVYLAQGRIDLAEAWERRVEPMLAGLPGATLDPVPLALAQLAVAAGRPAQAIARLASVLERAERLGLVSVRVRGLLLLALAHQAQGEIGKAAQAVKQAVLLGQPEGFIASFLLVGAPLVSHLVQARAAAPAYVDRILGLLGQGALRAAAASGSENAAERAPQPLVEPLSERELELLALLAAGLPNAAIAERLYIAPGTVKRHVHNILGKLEASDRQEAVAKGRALGLI